MKQILLELLLIFVACACLGMALSPDWTVGTFKMLYRAVLSVLMVLG